ncbi:hypothetical protein MD273_11750 [Marinobacter pelagius]|uniref:hypothetical protein n=1 Tax=Marinobacter sp. C7 TaxID=2951363 RepID=UPI001EF0B3B3|nr:hypothetical protein [Marinobacter sp. C7]MCG7200399.1 hypothetical protein [Marinobacter sp. C7]
MRHSCIFAAVSLALVNLGGCGLEDTGPSALNPATNVDPVFSSFTLTEQTATTLFHDLSLAIEPASSNDADASAMARDIRRQLSAFLAIVYSDATPPAITSVRNPLDLMRRVIGENEIANFVEARQYISARIDAGEAGEYSNTTNGVSVRFTDQGAFDEGQPVADYEWRYPIVKWVYTPDTSNRVTRVLTWASSGTFPEGSTRPSATLGTEFLPRDFQTTGYNDQARLHSEGSIVIAGEREMAFVREYDGLNTDTINIDGTYLGTNQGTTGGPEFGFAGETVDCLKIRMHYPEKRVEVFTSLDQPPRVEDPDNPGELMANPDYCLNQDAATNSYQTVDTGLRG